jgi:hypothetical protein
MEQGPNDTPSAKTIAETIIMPCFVAISSVSSSHLYHVTGTNTFAHLCANLTSLSINIVCVYPHDSCQRHLRFWYKESTPRLCAIIQV